MTTFQRYVEVQNKASRTNCNQGNRLIHSRRKKNLERLPRAPECKDGAETSTNVSGRA